MKRLTVQGMKLSELIKFFISIIKNLFKVPQMIMDT